MFAVTDTVTRTRETEERYLSRAKHLAAHAAEDLGLTPERMSPVLLVAWWVQRRALLSKSTWRQYRAALRFWLLQMSHEEARLAIEHLRLASASPCYAKSDKTSGQKSKQLTDRELSLLRSALITQDQTYARGTRLWLEASVLTGLRPSEWRNATLTWSDGCVLTVANAKATNGRSHGYQRRLDLCHLSPSQIGVIEAHLVAIRRVQLEGQFDAYYAACRECLRHVTRRLWPRRKKWPTLYTGRHQFSADAKRAGLSREEVAALLGHGSILTAARHYGRKRSGRAGFAVRSTDEDVARVLRLNEHRSSIWAPLWSVRP